MSTAESTIKASQGSFSAGLFVLAAVGVYLGLNDVWRLPALMVEHGSLWFPVLYPAVLLLVGLPLLTGELALARPGYSYPATSFGFRARPRHHHQGFGGMAVLAWSFDSAALSGPWSGMPWSRRSSRWVSAWVLC